MASRLRPAIACALGALLALGSTGCWWKREAASAHRTTTTTMTIPASASAAARARAKEAPPVSLATGTDSVEGVLVSWCLKDRCDRYPGATPKRPIEAAWRGVLLFPIGTVPTRARLQIKDARGAVVEEAPLQPGATMSYRQTLRKGTYAVTLTATWKNREATWLFALKVPSSSSS